MAMPDKKDNALGARPRRRIIGTGTLAALLAAGAFMAWNYQKDKTEKAVLQTSPRADFSGKFSPPGGPGISEMLSAREELSLTEGQRKKLAALDGEWRGKSKPAVELMKERAVEMQKYMNAAAEKKVTMDAMRDMAAPLSEATAQYRKMSGKYHARAIEVLTEEQRGKWAAREKGKL